MKYTELSYVNKPVSRLVLGTASPGFLAGENQNTLLDDALSLGITAIDTARQYGFSENAIGAWLKERKCREQVVLISKCAHPHPDGTKRVNEQEIRRDFALSAEALGTDYIDVLLLHRDDPEVEVGEIVEALNAMHREGKIGAFGGSNWTRERLAAANAYAKAHGLQPFTLSSPHYSLARQQADPWGGGCVSLTESVADRQWYLENKMPVLCYSSLGRGVLSGRLKASDWENRETVLDKYAIKGYGCEDNRERLSRCEILAKELGCSVSQVALCWLFTSPLQTMAVASMSAISRMQENCRALELNLTARQRAYLNLED